MKVVLIVTSLFLLTINSCSQQDEKKDLDELISKEANAFLKDNRFNAVSIAVYHKGESYIGHYGELDAKQNNTPTNETLYEIASVTKTMTGYLVACAVEEGKLALDTPVYEILGEEYRNLSYEKEPIRIIHLITHTSGIPLNISEVSELYQQPGLDNYSRARKILSTYTKQELLNELKSLKPTMSPGKVYSYSNVAPNLVAHILETVYDESFEKLIRAKLFEPAKMKSTFINLPLDKQAQLANGYNADHQLMPSFREPINLWGAAGRAKTTSEDMLQYIEWQLQTSNPVVKRSHQKLFKDTDNISIAYFWDVVKDKNGTHLEHHGGIYGCQNWLMIYPEYQLGISIITNVSFPEANQHIKQTASQLFNRLKRRRP